MSTDGPDRDPGSIRSMFNELAPDYDRVNRVVSLRLDQTWRRRLLDLADLSPAADVLDVGAGTGDLTLAAARRVPRGRVVAVDLAEDMLARARTKIPEASPDRGRIDLVQANGLRMPLPDGSVDAAVNAFTLRNVRDRAAFAREARRVLRPGGTFAALEIHAAGEGVLGRLAAPYVHHVLPRLGGFLSGKPDAYGYLSDSVEDFPAPEAVGSLLSDQGFRHVRRRTYMGGVVGAHVARCP